MKLLRLEADKQNVVAIVKERTGADDECPVLDFLHTQPKETAKSALGFKSLFQRYAKDGKAGLTTSSFHPANKEEGIWEFIKGRLRIFCFVDNKNNLIILSHGILKKGQKADPTEVACAVRNKKKYYEAAKKNKIVIEDIGNDY